MFGPKSGSSASRNHIAHQKHLGQQPSENDTPTLRKRLSTDSLSSTASGSGGGAGVRISGGPTNQQYQQPSSKTMTSSSSQQGLLNGNKELNIQVVVRIRDRSEREQKENSPVAVQAHNKKDILVPSTLGDRAPSKNYSFDRVFCYSDQEQIYNEVVTPILDEVLTGYNCTIFAYGQTGTGKTFTMEGDLRDNFGECSRDAGIIPRTLYQFFAALERKDTEYTVRVSFLELYNEEIKDLLAPDDDRKAVKIFDNLKKQGPLVQGLEEVAVFNAMQGIEALRRGSAKRTVAATKSNDKSSRSHGIFSITVHVKETTDDGEELLKIGKLNLVDLAGSENIARSGAEATQAKEAGRINQSLLTLGRVINSLVERSQHIPYRESKLTRLLEDSLGGKTKTCIIATISPARSCLEETISTLNYANRAKNIKNTPEINQKMSKKTLIKEYLLEIDRLKADLNATREKNGVFMTQESYQQLIDESSSRKDMVSEVQKMAEKAAQELGRMEEKFRDTMKLLTTTEIKLSLSNAELESKKAELQKTQDELEQTKRVLEEEMLLRKAHAHTEQHLNSVASGLRSTLSTSVKDIKGLHEKLERKNFIERENRLTIKEFQERLTDLAVQVEEKVEDHESKQRKLLESLDGLFNKAYKHTNSELTGTKLYLESQLIDLANTMVKFSLEKDHNAEAVADLRKRFEGMHQTTVDSLKKEAESAKINSAKCFDELKNALLEYSRLAETQHASMVNELLSLAEESRQFSQDRASQLSVSLASYEEATQKEIIYLQEQNQQLQHRLKTQEIAGMQQKDALLLQLGDSLDRFLKEQTSSLMGHFSDATDSIKLATGRLQSAHATQQTWTSSFNEKEQDHIAQLAVSRSEFQRLGDKGKEALAGERLHVVEVSSNGQSSNLNDIQSMGDHTQEEVARMHVGALNGYQEVIARSDNLEKLFIESSDNNATALKDLKLRTDKTIATVDDMHGPLINMVVDCTSEVEKFSEDSGRDVEQIREQVAEILPQRLKADDSTGRTPRRRQYKYPHTWGRTRPPTELLQEFRERGRVDVYTTATSDVLQDKDDSMADSDGSSHTSSSDPHSDKAALTATNRNVNPFEDPFLEPIANGTPTIPATTADASSPMDTSRDASPLVTGEIALGNNSLTENQQVSTPPADQPMLSGQFNLRKPSPLFTGQEAEKSKETVKTTVLPTLSQRGINSTATINNLSRPVRPSKGVGGIGMFSSIPKRTASEMEGSESSPGASSLSDISNKSHMNHGRSTAAVHSTHSTSLQTPTSGMFSSAPLSGAVFGGMGKSGLTNNGAEGPRKVSRPMPAKRGGAGRGFASR